MDEDKEVEGGEPSAKRRRTLSERPNFFVAVQISNPEIHREISLLQNFITSKKPLFKSTLINVITLHITLCTLHLPKNGDIRRAKTALRTLETNMKETLIKDPISLKFKGVGSFKNEVVFAKIESGEPLTRLKGLHINLVEALEEEGLIVKDKFEPHLTIMKMSKDRYLRKKKIFKIPKDLYEEHNEKLFGDQTVKGVQLLKMANRSANEYYHCYHQFDLGLQNDEMEDHQHCCGVESVLPSSLIEINPEDSDDETEEMFHDAKRVLDESMVSETDDAQKYVQKFEVKEDVLYNSLHYVAKNGNAQVEEACSRKINLKGKKIQNRRMKHRKYKVHEEDMSVESSTLKIKKLEIEEAEDLGLKFLLEEMEVEDIKVCDDNTQSDDPQQPQIKDDAVEVSNSKSETSNTKNLNDDSAVLPELAESDKVSKLETDELEEMGSKLLTEEKETDEFKLPNDNLMIADVTTQLEAGVAEKISAPSTNYADEEVYGEKNVLNEELVARHDESDKDGLPSIEETKNDQSSEIEESKIKLETEKQGDGINSMSEQNFQKKI